MLKKIDFIQNAGLYRSFTWGTLPELKRFNLFYGWNYSGKTTFSRILQSLERGVLPPEFIGGAFQVTHTDGAPLGTAGVLLHPKIRVFNRTFVENNFHQDMAGAKPVVVVGEENQKLKDRLRTLLTRQEKVSGPRRLGRHTAESGSRKGSRGSPARVSRPAQAKG